MPDPQSTKYALKHAKESWECSLFGQSSMPLKVDFANPGSSSLIHYDRFVQQEEKSLGQQGKKYVRRETDQKVGFCQHVRILGRFIYILTSLINWCTKTAFSLFFTLFVTGRPSEEEWLPQFDRKTLDNNKDGTQDVPLESLLVCKTDCISRACTTQIVCSKKARLHLRFTEGTNFSLSSRRNFPLDRWLIVLSCPSLRVCRV